MIASLLATAWVAGLAPAEEPRASGSQEPGWADLLEPATAVRKLLSARLGRDVAFSEVTWQMSPPLLRVGELTIAGEKPESAPLLIARKAVLAVDAAALLDGALAIEPLTAESATWTVRPEVVLDLVKLVLNLEARAQDDPLTYDGRASLTTGGALEIAGTGRIGGPVDVTLELKDVDLKPVAEAAPRVARLEGKANGEIRFAGDPRAPDSFDVDVASRDTVLALKDIALRKTVSLRADLKQLVGDERSGRARFDIDATLARLVMGNGVYRKKVGQPASVVGVIRRDARGDWVLDQAHLKVGPPPEGSDGGGSAEGASPAP